MERKDLNYSDYKKIEELEKRMDRLLYFSNLNEADDITLSYWAWSTSCRISCKLIDEYSVINAARAKALELAKEIDNEIKSIKYVEEHKDPQKDVDGSLPSIIAKIFRKNK